jgi:hypothetical protein
MVSITQAMIILDAGGAQDPLGGAAPLFWPSARGADRADSQVFARY